MLVKGATGWLYTSHIQVYVHICVNCIIHGDQCVDCAKLDIYNSFTVYIGLKNSRNQKTFIP